MESGEIFDEMTARFSCSLNYAAVVFIFRIIMRNFFIIIDSEHQDISLIVFQSVRIVLTFNLIYSSLRGFVIFQLDKERRFF